MGIIYRITNKLNGKSYIGLTTRSLETRWKQHLSGARRQDNEMLICKAISKHGQESFCLDVLEECDNNSIKDREKYWIEELRTHVSNGGYNLTQGGDGRLGYELSDESKEKIRIKATGRHHSFETRAKMSAAAKNRDSTLIAEKTIMMRLAKLGSHLSDDSKRRISESNKGKKRSVETCSKISEASKARIISEETRTKLSVANSNKKMHSDEFKKKLSEIRSRSISLVDSLGNVLASFSSLNQASKATGQAVVTISRSLAREKFPTSGKYMNTKWVDNVIVMKKEDDLKFTDSVDTRFVVTKEQSLTIQSD